MRSTRIPWYLVVSMLVSGTAAVIASLVSIQSLAVWADWDEWAAYLIPLTLDSLGASCIAIWAMSVVDDNARRYARQVALLTIGVSALLNALAHIVVIVAPRPLAGVTSEVTERSWWEILVIVGIAAIPPLALAGVIELAVKMRRPIERKSTTRRTVAPKVEQPTPPRVEVPAQIKIDVPTPATSPEVTRPTSRATSTRTTQAPRPDLAAEDAQLALALVDARVEFGRPLTPGAVRKWLASPEGQAKLALTDVTLTTIPGAGRAKRLAGLVEEAWTTRQNGHATTP